MSGEKTEKATPKRMKKVRADGGLGRSQDLSAWLGMGAAAIMLPSVLDRTASAVRGQIGRVVDAAANPEPSVAVGALSEGLRAVLPAIAPMLVVVVLAAVAAAAGQGGLHISTSKLKPSFKSLNLVSGVKRLFGPQSWWEGGKAAAKTLALGAVLYTAIKGLQPVLLGSGSMPLSALLDAARDGSATLIRTAVAVGLALAAADVFMVFRRNRKQTRMTKQEVKEENKSSEGDPLLKGAIRSRQMAMSRNRMMAAVADADVVLVNPTHVAVALRYEPGRGAPRVVAKGAGHVAARIREEAGKHRVPMVEDIPLARALHAACELGQEIPADLYAAVARVLAFVMALRRRGAAAGMHKVPDGTAGTPHSTHPTSAATSAA